jgi:hypothetical protein
MILSGDEESVAHNAKCDMPTGGCYHTPSHSGDHRHPRYETVRLPWYAPNWDDGYLGVEPLNQQPANTTSQLVVVVENKESPPPEPPKLSEVPQSKEFPVAKPQPPTLFVLKDGGRLESCSYLLTNQSLQIEVDRQLRTIPVSTLDLDATIAANHERGIEVKIPRDSSTVFLGF